jgi:DNA-binding MurR/RpiR family transcriptional regulator
MRQGISDVTMFEKAIKKNWKQYTTSEQKLATFFLQHLRELPFETAASIAKRLEVSAMTVGRFIKKLGYDDLRAIKDDLRSVSPVDNWLAGELSRAPFEDAPLKAKLKAVTDVHNFPQSPEWSRIVSLVATADKVSVAAFQLGRFLGLGFASALQTLRPNVHFADGSDGAYIDVLLDSTPRSCLVLIEFKRYSRHFRILAEEAVSRKLPTVIITDDQCYWAREITDNVLLIKSSFESSWERLSITQALLELLLAAVGKQVKAREKRYEAITRLREKFIGFTGPERSQIDEGRSSPRKKP